MSKKDKRIKDLEETLRASVARSAIVARENRELWVAYEAVRVERDELERRLSTPGTEVYWRNIAKRILKDRDDDKEKYIAELEVLQDQMETAHRWKTYADSIESQIEILQTAIDDRDERLGKIKFFLSDGDE